MANTEEEKRVITKEEELLLILSDVAIILLEYMESVSQQVKATNINAANYKDAKPEVLSIFNNAAANLITLNDILHPMFDILPRLFPDMEPEKISDFALHRKRQIQGGILPDTCDCTLCLFNKEFDAK